MAASEQHSLILRSERVARASRRMEANAPVAILRDAGVRPAPQDEVFIQFAIGHSLFANSHPFSVFTSTGRNASLAFLSSVSGSAPVIMLVSAIPNVSRNSVTATISGSPARAI